MVFNAGWGKFSSSYCFLCLDTFFSLIYFFIFAMFLCVSVCVCHNFICLNSHFADDCFIFGFRFNFQFSLERSILNPYNDSFLIISSIRFWYFCKRNSFAIIDVINAIAIFSNNGNSNCIYTFSFIDFLLECSDFDKLILFP